MNKERWYFKLMLTGNQEEHMEFIGKIIVNTATSLNYKSMNGIATCSLKCNTQEEFKKIYHNLDQIILNYL